MYGLNGFSRDSYGFFTYTLRRMLLRYNGNTDNADWANVHGFFLNFARNFKKKIRANPLNPLHPRSNSIQNQPTQSIKSRIEPFQNQEIRENPLNPRHPRSNSIQNQPTQSIKSRIEPFQNQEIRENRVKIR